MKDEWVLLDDEGNETGFVLDGGTLDFMIVRDSRGWRALRWALIRPWRWHTIPRIIRTWPLRGTVDFR